MAIKFLKKTHGADYTNLFQKLMKLEEGIQEFGKKASYYNHSILLVCKYEKTPQTVVANPDRFEGGIAMVIFKEKKCLQSMS